MSILRPHPTRYKKKLTADFADFGTLRNPDLNTDEHGLLLDTDLHGYFLTGLPRTKCFVVAAGGRDEETDSECAAKAYNIRCIRTAGSNSLFGAGQAGF